MCIICGFEHENKCPLIKAYEYFPDGTIKRVEFLTPADFHRQPELLSLPTHATRQ